MERIGVGLIGTGFMGKCHAMAFGGVKAAFGDVPHVDRVALCDVEPIHAKQKADEFGFARATTNWRDLLGDPAIHLISITSPNGMHREMAVAALAAGKHVWCEKPMALTLADAKAMTTAAEKAKPLATALGYAYLRNPALQHAWFIIEAGVFGDVFDFSGSVDEDFMADPTLPWSWRMTRDGAGLGTLGDLTCHLVSLAHELVGEIGSLCAMADVVHAKRPMAQEQGKVAVVENDDIAHAVIRFRNGARGVMSSSRVAHGRKNGLKVEVHGSKGMLWLDYERMNELNLYVAEGDQSLRGFRRILSSPQHPGYGNLCPAPGHGLGFNELKLIELAEILKAVEGKPSAQIDFSRGLPMEKTIHAFAKSSEARAWITIA